MADTGVNKSSDAFRTIGEAAEILGVAQHVLRFWEGKFRQLKPVKRRGRRYYRPEDLVLLKKIKKLLYEEGFTIKGVQKFLKNGSMIVNEKEEKQNALNHSELVILANTQSSSQPVASASQQVSNNTPVVEENIKQNVTSLSSIIHERKESSLSTKGLSLPSSELQDIMDDLILVRDELKDALEMCKKHEAVGSGEASSSTVVAQPVTNQEPRQHISENIQSEQHSRVAELV